VIRKYKVNNKDKIVSQIDSLIDLLIQTRKNVDNKEYFKAIMLLMGSQCDLENILTHVKIASSKKKSA